MEIVVKKSGVKGANLLVRIPGWVRNQVVLLEEMLREFGVVLLG